MSAIYSFLIVAIISLWVLHRTFFPKSPQYYCVLVGMMLFVVLGFRNVTLGLNVGVDLLRYADHFLTINHYEDVNEAISFNIMSPAYWLVNFLFAKAGLSFQFFIMFTAVVCTGTMVYYIRKHSSNCLLSFFTFLGMGTFTFWFSGLKQSYAMSTALLFFDAYMMRRYKKSIFWMILSILFHWSSIVLIPFCFVGRLRITKLLLFSYGFALIILLIFSRTFGETITMIFAEGYLGHYESSGTLGGSLYLSVIILLLYLFFVYDKAKKSHQFFLHGLIIICMIQACASYAYAFTRVNFFYMNGVMALVAAQLGNKRELNKNIAGLTTPFAWMFSMGWVVIMSFLYFAHIRGEQLSDYYFMWDN